MATPTLNVTNWQETAEHVHDPDVGGVELYEAEDSVYDDHA
jgi:hypothetical protein